MVMTLSTCGASGSLLDPPAGPSTQATTPDAGEAAPATIDLGVDYSDRCATGVAATR